MHQFGPNITKRAICHVGSSAAANEWCYTYPHHSISHLPPSEIVGQIAADNNSGIIITIATTVSEWMPDFLWYELWTCLWQYIWKYLVAWIYLNTELETIFVSFLQWNAKILLLNHCFRNEWSTWRLEKMYLQCNSDFMAKICKYFVDKHMQSAVFTVSSSWVRCQLSNLTSLFLLIPLVYDMKSPK